MLTPGTPIRVRDDWPETRGPCHIRTPHYLRGRHGTVLRHLGNFPNPEDLAFARPAPTLPLYHVAFPRQSIWPCDDTVVAPCNDTAVAPVASGAPPGELVIELFEPWLETVP